MNINRKPMIKRRASLPAVVLALFLFIGAAGLGGCGQMPAAEPTPVPTADSTPAPTPEPTPIPLAEGPAEQISSLGVSCGDTRLYSLTDDSFYFIQYLPADAVLQLSASEEIRTLYILWHDIPAHCFVDIGDGERDVLDGSHILHQCLILDHASSSVTLRIPDEESSLCEIYAFTDGALPDWVQRWELMEEPADILLVSTHSDDEFCFFGGIIPIYAGERGYRVQVVYMIHHTEGDGRYRVHELLSGLWYAGDRYYPEINDQPDRMYDTLEEAAAFYGAENFERFQVEMIRKYKPLVVLGHDFNGEYGHSAHKLNAKCLAESVLLASDETQFPESAERYGTWDPQKFYVHLYPENAITLDYETPLEHFGGRTGYEVAYRAFLQHQTQLDYGFVHGFGARGDSHQFGLYRSLVGVDTEPDLMEHTHRDP